jgi:hypothetical protein
MTPKKVFNLRQSNRCGENLPRFFSLAAIPEHASHNF